MWWTRGDGKSLPAVSVRSQLDGVFGCSGCSDSQREARCSVLLRKNKLRCNALLKVASTALDGGAVLAQGLATWSVKLIGWLSAWNGCEILRGYQLWWCSPRVKTERGGLRVGVFCKVGWWCTARWLFVMVGLRSDYTSVASVFMWRWRLIRVSMMVVEEGSISCMVVLWRCWVGYMEVQQLGLICRGRIHVYL